VGATLSKSPSSNSDYLVDLVDRQLNAYAAHPDLLLEHAEREEQLLSGGYGHRQLYELVQNGADAISEASETGRIEVVLTDHTLYCANQGSPLSRDGIRALLMAELSPKRGDEIGRFGVGFKSVLRICDRPEILSSTGCIAFNPSELEERLRELNSSATRLPRLRTARALDFDNERAEDPILDSLFDWATTVVRLRLTPGSKDRLADDLRSFPAEFLVFVPHVHSLTLGMPGDNWRRALETSQQEFLIVHDGDQQTEWRVFSEKVLKEDLSPEEVEDMDHRLRDRPAFPLVWAAPAGMTQRQRGQLWAFFPTQTETTLQGILNAPWKTNSDRENLLDGPFNRALLRRAAMVVAERLPELNTNEDPGRFIDALPARDTAGWADVVLTTDLLNELKCAECMPTADGKWAVPSEVCLRPRGLPTKELAKWLDQFAGLEPSELAHRSLETRDRGARARRLGCTYLNVSEWLVLVARQSTADASIAAIHIAELAWESTPQLRWSIGHSAFVLTKQGELLRPDPDRVAFAFQDQESAGLPIGLVHALVASDLSARTILETRFKISEVSPNAIFRSLLRAESPSTVDWDAFWRLARGLAPEAVAEAVSAMWPRNSEVCAMNLEGEYAEIGQMLLVGGVVHDANEASGGGSIIDHKYHEQDLPVLELLGASDVPRLVGEHQAGGHVLNQYRRAVIKSFQRACKDGGFSNPRSGYVALEPPTGKRYVAPLDPIKELDGESAVRFSRWLAEVAGFESSWAAVHKTRRDAYPEVAVKNLAVWALGLHAWAPTSLGPRRISIAVHDSMRRWSSFLPVVDSDSEVASLGLIRGPDDMTSRQWNAAIRKAAESSVELVDLTAFYALAANSKVEPPEELRCRIGDSWAEAAPSDIKLASDLGELRILEAQAVPALFSPSRKETRALIEDWGMCAAPHSDVQFEPSSEAIRAVDRFPSLAGRVVGSEAFRLQPCLALWREVRDSEDGLARYEATSILESSCLYYLVPQGPEWILTRLREYGIVELSADESLDLITEAGEVAVAVRKGEIRAHETLEERLLSAVGEDLLRSGIPERHLAWLDTSAEAGDAGTARLALAVHGIEVLRQYSKAMAGVGLQPPQHWAGGVTTKSFVTDLGFPEEYAGFARGGREPWVDERGPLDLPPLHEFQRAMCDEIVDFLCEDPPSRGLLSLPTGSGKTRVTVQALIEWVLKSPRPANILWVAGSDELCEQAVESWVQAWRALGPENGQLRVNRLWGATNELVRAPESGTNVVVATFQSLATRVDRSDLAWVFSPEAVVIDEAHGATTRSYTAILAALGLDRKETTRPLIGLTATPFRGGTDERETLRLAFRFRYRRFDLELWEKDRAYVTLQKMGILAHADHEVLTGERLRLSEEDLAGLERFNRLPSSVELELGRDESRNARILDHIRGLPGDWTVLVFATSTEHAEDLSVRLTMGGIPSRAITGETPVGLRRHSIEAFKRGRLRVLTNYGVLTTGFDAPAVRAVYVARPVYSPLLYQQMIGRGLRGPKNGGKEQCLIVNVEDNVMQYGEALAFHGFEYIWRR
jgi:superfamily II DNA or RNA helicase